MIIGTEGFVRVCAGDMDGTMGVSDAFWPGAMDAHKNHVNYPVLPIKVRYLEVAVSLRMLRFVFFVVLLF